VFAFRTFEPHSRADERRDQFVVLIAVFLANEVLDPPSSEVAVDRSLEPVENDARAR
jgi:hypothetical protein